MTTQIKASAIVTIEKLRFLESEIFRIASKYGIKNIDELDRFIASGKLTEEQVGEDLFLLDHLLSEKDKLEKKLKNLSVKKSQVWENFQNLLGLQKPNFQMS